MIKALLSYYLLLKAAQGLQYWPNTQPLNRRQAFYFNNYNILNILL